MKVLGMILLAVLLIIVILVLIAAVRTACMKVPEKTAAPACREDSDTLDQYAHDFGELLKVRTVSHKPETDLEPFRRLHGVMDTVFPLCTKNLEKINLNETLLYHWHGKDSTRMPILFMGHQDVVPAEDAGWDLPPFDGKSKDGCLYGRGTMDCKCNIFTQMSAVEQLLKEGYQPECDVWLEYSINEETSGTGASDAVAWFQKNHIRFACVIDEGGMIVEQMIPGMNRPCAVIGVTEKGYIDLKVTAKGKGGHSSTPRKETTVTRLASYIHDINTHSPFQRSFYPACREMFEAMAPAFGFGMRMVLSNLWLFGPLLAKVMPAVSADAAAMLGTTCAFTRLQGSDANNVIPAEASATANLRTGYTQGVKESLELMKQAGRKYNLEYEVITSREASPVTSSKSPVYRYLTDCIHDCFPDAISVPYVMAGATDCRHYTAISDNCLRFAPLRATSQQVGSCHGINENITMTSAAEGIDFYKYFIQNYKGE